MNHLLTWVLDGLPMLGLAAVVVAGVGLALFLWRRPRMSDGDAARSAVLDAALLLTLVGIVLVGLRPGTGEPEGWVQWHLVPFLDLIRSLGEPGWMERVEIANLLGNIVLFVPWGALMAVRFRRLGVVAFIAVTVLLSTAIEIGQAVEATGRYSDVTDVLMNTVGGGVGFAAARAAVVRARGRTGDQAGRA